MADADLMIDGNDVDLDYGDKEYGELVDGVRIFFERRGELLSTSVSGAVGLTAARERWQALCDLGLPSLLADPPAGVGAPLTAAVGVAECLGAVLVPEPAVSAMVIGRVVERGGAGQGLLADIGAGRRIVALGCADGVRLHPDGSVSGAVRMIADGLSDAVALPGRTETGEPRLAVVEVGGLPPATDRSAIEPGRPVLRYCLDRVSTQEVLPVRVETASEVLRDQVLLTSAELVGGMAQVLHLTVHHLRRRRQFGRSLAGLQAVKHQLADMYVGVQQARAVVRHAAFSCVGARPGQADADVAAATRWTTAAAIGLYERAVQLHGAMGYTWELGVHLYLRRALAVREVLGGWGRHR